MLLNCKGHSHSPGCSYINDFSNATVLSTKSNFSPHHPTPHWTSTIITLLKIQTCLPMGIPHFRVLHIYSKKTAWPKNNSTKREFSTLSQSVTLPLERFWFLWKMKKNGQLDFPVQLTVCKKSCIGLVFNQLCYSTDSCIVQLDEVNAEGSPHKYFRP